MIAWLCCSALIHQSRTSKPIRSGQPRPGAWTAPRVALVTRPSGPSITCSRPLSTRCRRPNHNIGQLVEVAVSFNLIISWSCLFAQFFTIAAAFLPS